MKAHRYAPSRGALSRACFILLAGFLLLSARVCSLEAEDLDLRTATAGEYSAVFNQLAEGLEYTADGEIVVSPGKRLPYNDATRIALIHYIAKQNPTVTFVVTRKCSTCSGVGSGVRFEGREGANLGYQVHWVCGACNGRATYQETMSRRLVYGGELPQKWDSPKVLAFRRRLRDADEGSPAAQLEVAACYVEGKLVPKSAENARRWFTKAAVQGEQSALAPLAQLYRDEANPFHDLAFGLALGAVASPESALADGDDFVRFKEVANDASSPEAGLKRHMQVLEAGLLAPVIARGLRDKKSSEKVLMPDTVRTAFSIKAPLPSDAVPDARAAFVRGVAAYFGHGHPNPDNEEALRLFELAASKRDAAALLLLGMHYDVGRVYPASPATAWAFYAVASRAGSTEPFSERRLRIFDEAGVAAEWRGAPDPLFSHFQAAAIPPAMFRQLADLSLYRTLRFSGKAAGRSPYDTAATQGSPLTKSEAFSRSRSLLMQKLQVVELAEEDVSVVRKSWDDGATRFYSVSGLITFTNASSRRETAPYTLCFKLSELSSPPVLISLSAGSAVYGEAPAQCGRQP